ncbi:MAG: SET domain-containing protein-lysine N-methyltransferase [Verrucomicrobiota bacterium]
MSAAAKTQSSPAPTATPWAEVRGSVIHGRGMYAVQRIPKGTRIIEYVGERITQGEANRRDAARLARKDRGDDGCVYLFEVNKRALIDGDVEWNTARLINHSCAPNCEPQNIRGRIWIVALKNIPAGAELAYDYGFEFDNWRDHPCRCGHAGCVGYIVGKAHRRRVRRILGREQPAAQARQTPGSA